MIANLNPYPKYEDSQLPWLARVPAHWEVRRAKSILQRLDQRSKSGSEELLTVSSARGVVPRRTAAVTMFKAESYAGYKLCWPGDLVINSLWAWAGGLGVSNYHGIVSSAYGVYRIRRPAKMLPRFLHEVVRSSSFNWEFKIRSKGVWTSRLQLTDVSFLDAPIVIPPLPEQAAIVRFLDWANARLERAIRAKHRVIALLNEQKQAIIHRAVTRGLDASVQLGPSGTPWLGDIPKGWDVSRIKNEFQCLNHRRIPLSSPERGRMTRREFAYYGASGIIDTVDDFLFDDELVLVAEDGANLVLRNLPLAIIARGKFWVNNHAHILKPKRGNIEYLAAVLETLNYRPWITGAAQPKLTQDRLMSIAICVAPIDVQEAIVAHMIKQTAPIQTAISRLQRETDLVREYRTRLVADVVTGKLDVREAAARLANETVAETAEIAIDADDEFAPNDEELVA